MRLALSRGRLAGALALGAALAGCGAGAGDALPPECAEETPCGAGLLCVQGACVFAAAPTVELGAEVSASDEDPQTRQELYPLDLAAPQALALRVEAPVELSGRVLLGLEGVASVPARVLVTRAARIPGRPPLAVAVDAAGDVGPGGVAFAMALPPPRGDEQYQVRVEPREELADQVPPVELPLALTGDALRELRLPGLDEVVLVRGRVVDAAGLGVPGLEVRLLTDEGDRVVSTRAITSTADADRGAFELRVATSLIAVERTLRVSPSDLNPDAPELTFRGVTLPVAAPLDVLELGDLAEPAFLRPQPYRFTVEGTGKNGATGPVAGARVRFVSTLSDDPNGLAVFVREAESDAAGVVAVGLIPRLGYDRVEVLPPAGSSLAAQLRTDFTTGEPGGLADTFALGPRTEVSGTVTGPDGRPLEGVTLDALPIPAVVGLAPLAVAGAPAMPGSTTSDRTGQFTLDLDPGTFDLEIVPPDGTPYARGVVARLEVSAAADAADGDVDGRIALALEAARVPRATLLRGAVLDAAGAAIPGATIRLFQVSCAANVGSGPTAECLALPARLRALARAADDGLFQAFLGP